jgi:hypothetical protein
MRGILCVFLLFSITIKLSSLDNKEAAIKTKLGFISTFTKAILI